MNTQPKATLSHKTSTAESALLLRSALLLMVLMFVTSAGVTLVRSELQNVSVVTQRIGLAAAIPREFAGWREITESRGNIVNPQAQQLLDKLYTEVVGRTYVNNAGDSVMLSLAYGSDQRGELQAHTPELCYPSQGFTVLSKSAGTLSTRFGEVQVTRMDTQLGARREPLTYWLAMGAENAQTKLRRRLQEIRLVLTGRVPDGLVFRVSSVTTDTARAYDVQDGFIRDLLAATSPDVRRRLSGLSQDIPEETSEPVGAIGSGHDEVLCAESRGSHGVRSGTRQC